MTDINDRISELSPLKRALLAMEEMQDRIKKLESGAPEPIAIIGMACRFPGADSPEIFWNNLLEGKDAIREVPSDRWDVEAFYDPDPQAPGKMYTRWGGFLDNIDKFDASFFGISPREANYLDPQQRLLLEVAWEALENSGTPAAEMVGSQTGVFIGISGNDYASLMTNGGGIEEINPYNGTGTAFSVASGRLSYVLGLNGPSVSIDTACSSSLVAVHQACQSLRSKECNMALAGGVNAILSPEGTVYFSKLHAMASDGRCKTFDASADGYVRSEGCGVVILKRLSDAMADGDLILAIIRGSAINQDGRSNGLTAPNGLAQQAVIRSAINNAGISAHDVSYLEAHGTGTELGDPIEIRSIGAVQDGRDAQQPLVVGSVKANIGHTEAAAGVAGLIKVVMALRAHQIPGQLHVKKLNPYVNWQDLPLIIPTGNLDWGVPGGKPRIAGLSSFGFSGTNVHVIIAEAPDKKSLTTEELPEKSNLLVFSGRTPQALTESARDWKEFLSSFTESTRLHDVLTTASQRRSHYLHRLALVGNNRQNFIELLEAYLADQSRPDIIEGKASPHSLKPKIAFVFSGQGGQWVGMGRQLLVEEPIFHQALIACDASIQKITGWSLIDQLMAEGENSRLNTDADVMQPALFGIQVGLSSLWRSWGFEPDAVVGHSLGEVAAAYIAGILSLDDAARIVCLRSRLMSKLSGKGAMAVIGLPSEEVDAIVDSVSGKGGRVSVAVLNGPRSTAISGDPQVIEQIIKQMETRDIFCRKVKIPIAFHSAQMDDLRPLLVENLANLKPVTGEIPFYSTVQNRILDGAKLDADYWGDNLRDPVLFWPAIQGLAHSNHEIYIEIGPHPVLTVPIKDGLRELGKDGIALPSCRRDEPERSVLMASVGNLYTRGYSINWQRVFSAPGNPVSIPSYPWQKEHYWVETTWQGSQGGVSGARKANPIDHPLLGCHLDSAVSPGRHYWEQEISAQSIPYLKEFRVAGDMVLPATAYLEMALAAIQKVNPGYPVILKEFDFLSAMKFVDEAACTVQSHLEMDSSGTNRFQVFSQTLPDGSTGRTWTRHAQGLIDTSIPASVEPDSLKVNLSEIRGRCNPTLAGNNQTTALERNAIVDGFSSQWLTGGWGRIGEFLGQIQLPDVIINRKTYQQYLLHPILLESTFFAVKKGISQGFESIGEPIGDWIPIRVEKLKVISRPSTGQVWSYVVYKADQPYSDQVTADLKLLDDEGNILVDIHGLVLKRLEPHDQESALDWIYQLAWEPQAIGSQESLLSGNGASGWWLIFDDQSGVGNEIRLRIENQGYPCVSVTVGTAEQELDRRKYQINPDDEEAFRKLLVHITGLESSPCKGIIYLWGLNDAGQDDSQDPRLSLSEKQSEDVVQIALKTSTRVLYLTQTLVGAGFNNLPRLWIITRDVQVVSEKDTANGYSKSILWGLGRTIIHELPDLRCTLVDLSRLDTDEYNGLLRELFTDSKENQVAIRGNKRFVARLTQVQKQADTNLKWQPYISGTDHNFELRFSEPGNIESLFLHQTTRRQPGAGEIEIEVISAGINPVDLSNLRNQKIHQADNWVHVGVECSGRVSAIGEGVTDFLVGDAVVAFAENGVKAYTITRAELAVRKPEALTWDEAASIPLAFVTASYALNNQGHMKSGEYVLIHDGSSGQGLAAIQLAQLAGLEIFTTTGSKEAQRYLEGLGLANVMDMHSLVFGNQIRLATGDAGVDLVFNTLSGQAMEKSLDCLAPFGRFIDVGQQETYESTPLSPLSHYRNMSYLNIAIIELIRERPALAGEILRSIMARFSADELKPIPVHTFSISQISEAFRKLQSSNEIGNITINLSEQAISIAADAEELSSINSSETYLITGGFDEVGLSLAQWLVEKDARSVVLVGSRVPTPSAQKVIGELRKNGAQVMLRVVNLEVRSQVEELLDQVHRLKAPLRGVIHAAGVHDDGLLFELNRERFERVFGSKIGGAWNLHDLTQNDELKFFILFSSTTSLIGSPGQGNIASANAYLDGLAHYRHTHGLPAISINWTGWRDIEETTDSDQTHWLSQLGINPISLKQGASIFQQVLEKSITQAGVLPIDHEQLHQAYPAIFDWPYFEYLLVDAKQPGGSNENQFLSYLKSIPPGTRQTEALLAHMGEQLSRVLGMAGSNVDVNTSLAYLGLDSLMAVELKNRVESDLDVVIPVATLLRGPTLKELVDELLPQINTKIEPAKTNIIQVDIEPELTPEGYREYPLSRGQRALWFQHQMSPGSVYNPSYVVKINSAMDIDAALAASEKLVSRHPALRTTFAYVNGETVQRVHESGRAFLLHEDASTWSEAELNDRLIREVYHVYDLEKGPLVRLLLFSRSTQEHILMLAAHHIVVDLWSLTLIANEFASFYGNPMADSVLPNPIVKYTDYVNWHEKLLESPQGQAMLAYWRENLSGELPVLNMPTDHPRPPIQTYTGTIQSLNLGSELTTGIRKLASQIGVTPFVVLLAAFKTLLYRYTGQEDIIVGSPTTGRTKAELANVIGYFVSPVALRSNLANNPKFSVLLKSEHQCVVEALANQDYPFVSLVENLRPERDPSRPPIFQVMFALQRSHIFHDDDFTQLGMSQEGVQVNLGGITLSSVVLDNRMSPYELTLQVADSEREMTAAFEYNVDLFNKATIQRMLNHYKNLLESIVTNPDQTIAQLDLLSPEEYKLLVVDFNATEYSSNLANPENDLCLHRLFESRVAQKPDAIAVVFEDQAITYGELNRKANRLAHYLQLLGIGPDTIVGICVERSIEMILGILAVLKAGGAYLPMDPVYPADRLAFMMQDAGVPVLLTQSHLVNRLPTLTSRILYLDQNWEAIARELLGIERLESSILPISRARHNQTFELTDDQLDQNPDSPVTAGNMAYVIYTSGSTGRSKGVMIQHHGICNLVSAQIDGFVMSGESRTLQFASFSFDASVSEIFTTLVAGATLYLTRLDQLLALPALAKFMNEQGITVVTLPPSVLATLHPHDLPGLKTLVSAGESCTPELAARWAAGRYFLNAYGPTETTVGPTYYRIDGRFSDEKQILERLKGYTTVPIGKPIRNMVVYILDTHCQPVPVGVVGEMYIGGPGIARGYLNRPEMTVEKFVIDPLDRQPGRRMYRTGDLARYLPDGNIEFLGRIDFQVKLRGFRIELEEIESVLSQHPQVQQAVVLVRGKRHDDKKLVAFVVPEKSRPLGANDLRMYLRSQLPEYMVPAVFVVLDHIPLTPNGKVDRNALPETNGGQIDSEVAYLPPSTEMERMVVRVWQNVLEIDRVGLYDNFFDLGGHSLLLYKVHGQLQEALGREFSLVDLFRFPTVKALSEFLGRDPQELLLRQKSQDRAEQQRDAMKRQVDKMREIANTRAAVARQAALRRVGPVSPPIIKKEDKSDKLD